MTDTTTLIASLSSEAHAPVVVRTPAYWSGLLITVLAVYGVVAQLTLGLRPDLAMQFNRPLFALEIGLLAVLLLASIVASVLAVYPDAYQKPKLLILPYVLLLFLLGAVISQLFMPIDMRMMMPLPSAHAMECAICIGSVSLIPSALIFALLRKGASVHPFQAGSFAVLSAGSIGCLTLRLAEANDSIMHLASWHYLPTLIFASIGAVFGKWLLKW